jgi:hypothetical protein
MVSVSLVAARETKSSSSLLSKARKDSEILKRLVSFFLAGVSSVKSTHVSLEPGDESKLLLIMLVLVVCG